MTFDERVTAVIDVFGTKAVQLTHAYREGAITDTELIDALTALTVRSRDQAAIEALRVLQDYLKDGGLLFAPALPAYRARAHRQAFRTALTADGDTLMKIQRIITAESLDSAHIAYQKALAGTRGVDGWIRGMNADACELCQWWWRKGRVWPKTHVMPTHKGCTCHQVPVIAKGE